MRHYGGVIKVCLRYVTVIACRDAGNFEEKMLAQLCKSNLETLGTRQRLKFYLFIQQDYSHQLWFGLKFIQSKIIGMIQQQKSQSALDMANSESSFSDLFIRKMKSTCCAVRGTGPARAGPAGPAAAPRAPSRSPGVAASLRSGSGRPRYRHVQQEIMKLSVDVAVAYLWRKLLFTENAGTR
ncbi:hypothetical protein AV530_016903 [Patagioenas fasciata monilis]|uniref:Uncharacterized protein n=1 Tax=Patagioenas fasciata monilis TaxID=372326 RepID=A0A1V4J487_PATFA|nr:hypothetical protein AV530_016903 [Patagioenas fasciata monilis]